MPTSDTEKKQDTVYDPVLRLAKAIENQSIVLEGINTQLYLLREELGGNWPAKDDDSDDDAAPRMLVRDRVCQIIHAGKGVRA